jgi:DNA-binding MarR family transcriptional regulator
VAEDWVDRVVERLAALRPPVAPDVYLVTSRVTRIATRLALRQEETFGRFGLSRGDVGVLSTLLMAPPPHTLSPTQLFRGLMLSSAGMTKRLDQLERRGLVQRKPDPSDRRGIAVHLTDDGRKLVTKAIVENTRSESALLAGFDRKEQRQFADLLRKLLGRLESPAGE